MQDALLASVKNLMDSLKVTMDEAMTILKIPAEERAILETKLAK
jgi:hypothetical protein